MSLGLSIVCTNIRASPRAHNAIQKQLTYPSIAVNKAGWIGLGSSVGDGYGMGAGLISVDPMTSALT